MGMVKQHLLEQQQQESIQEKLELLSEYYDMDIEQVRMMCSNAAVQKGITFDSQVLVDFEDIDTVMAYESALARDQAAELAEIEKLKARVSED